MRSGRGSAALHFGTRFCTSDDGDKRGSPLHAHDAYLSACMRPVSTCEGVRDTYAQTHKMGLVQYAAHWHKII